MIAVHPASTLHLVSNIGQVTSLSSPIEQAKAIVPLLLEIFIKGHPGQELIDGELRRWAPWTWSTKDEALATAMQTILRSYGVREALCHVGACTKTERESLEKAFFRTQEVLMDGMAKTAPTEEARAHFRAMKQIATMEVNASNGRPKPGDDAHCYHCKKVLTEPRKKCAACGQAYYCDRDCQKSDWKLHKMPECKVNRLRPTCPTAHMHASTYYNSTVHSVVDAQTLAEKLNIVIPSTSKIDDIA